VNSFAGRLVGIALSGTGGVLAAWLLVRALALDGTLGALATAVGAMAIATAAFTGWTTLGRALGRRD
jgi:hypothetical protein